MDFKIYIGGEECEIQGNNLRKLSLFTFGLADLSSQSQIACLAPPSKVAGNQIIKIYVNSIEFECPEDLCLVSYIAGSGSLKYIVPNVLHPGDNIKVGGGGKSLQSLSQSTRNNQYFCDFANNSSSNFTSNGVEFNECTVGDLPSGYYTASIQTFSEQERVVLDSSTNSDDFNVTIIPQIKALSKNKISSAGDKLIISGLGFSNVLDQNEVYYENNNCTVTFANYSVIKCDLVAPTILNSAAGIRAGQIGVRSKTYTYEDGLQDVDWTNGGSFSEDYASFEYINFNESPVARVIEGLFKAPAAGAYTFYLSAMGPAQLNISSTPLTEDNLIVLAEIEKGTEFRDFSAPNEKSQVSKPLQLTAGEYYYLRVLHLDDGNGHLTVGVKIPGKSQTFAPIPSELLFTAESLSQVTVRTEGLLGSCPVGVCDLELDKSVRIPIFSEFGWNYNMLSIMFQGPLSLSFSDFESISFGNAEAVILSYDSNSGILSASVPLTTSQNQPSVVAGQYIPRVIISNSGFAQAAASVIPFEISPMVIQADAQGAGGDQSFLEFDVQGAFFGFSLDQSYGTKVDIGGVQCQITELENDYLKCTTEDIVSSGPFNIVVNGIQSQEDIVTFSDPGLLETVQVESGEERILDIQLTGSFDPTLETIIAIVNAETMTKCQVISQGTNSVKCLISQLMPGSYNLVVTQIASLGFFTQSSQTFTVNFGIKSVSPSIGSQLGNTLLTLTGEGFLLENTQVVIGAFRLPCNNVTVINSTTIECLTSENIYGETGPQEVQVIGSGSSIAECLVECSFAFSDNSTPLVQEISNSVASPGSQLTLSGLNFATTNVKVLIGSFSATVLQVSANTLIVKLPDNIVGSNLPLSVSDSTLGKWKVSDTISVSIENPYEPFIRKWSNATQWPNKKLPKKGDSVLVPSTWNLQLDIDPPSLGTLTIQGKLAFDGASTLTAEKILVLGTLEAGTEGQPFENTAQIHLAGANSLLQVTGKIELIGKSKNSKAKLRKTVQAGSTQIQVEGDVSQWLKGDQILITPSRQNPLEYDLTTIKAIQGNVITLDSSLDFFHSGEIYDTGAPLFGEIDMRAEVLLLTRNIQIQGTTAIKNGATFVLDHVNFDSCSKKTVETPVLDLDSVDSGVIAGSVFSNCLGWGVKFSQTKDTNFADNIIFNVQDYGLAIGENNTALDIQDNSIVLVKSTEKYQNTAVSQTSSAVYFAGCDDNDVTLLNNVASGCQNLCYSINFSKCKNGAFFKNNTAYSSNIGFLAFNIQSTALELTESFTAFQNSIGVATNVQNVTLSGLRLADNSNSLLLYGSNSLQLTDSFFAGFGNSRDIADCSNSYGIIIGQSPPGIDGEESCQSQNQNYDLGDHLAILENNYFSNFKKSDCADHRLFKVQQNLAENMPLIQVKKSKSTEVDRDSIVFFNTTSITNSQCNGFECSGIYNALLQDLDGSLTNNPGVPTEIIPNNIGVVSQSCDFNEAIDGYICSSDNFGILTFKSSSSSLRTQVASPAQISSSTNEDHSFLNLISPLNLCSASDDVNQYTSIVEFGSTYNLSFENSFSPNTLNFSLSGGINNDSVAAFIIKCDDVRIVSIINIETQERIDPYFTVVDQKPVLQLNDSCGANLIDLDQNYIEFNLRSDALCKLSISKIDSLVGYIRFDIPPEEFWEREGHSLFIEKLSSVLDASSSQIRINSIKKGSTIVDFTVLAQKQGTQELEQKLETLREATAQGKISILGAPILDYSYKTITVDKDTRPAAIGTIEAGGHSVGFYFGMVLGPLILFLVLGVVVSRWDRSYRKKKVRVAAEIKMEQIITQTPTKQVIQTSSTQQVRNFMIGPDRELIDNPLTLQTLPTESDVGESETETPRTERGEARDNVNLLKRKNFQDLNTVLENNEEEDLNENKESNQQEGWRKK